LNALQLVNECLSRFGQHEVTTLTQTAESTLMLRKVNLAIQEIATAHPFVWAEKNDAGQLTAVAGTSVYTLATDVAHILAVKHVYQGGDWIKPENRATFEQQKADRSQTADRTTPRLFTSAGVLQAAATDTPALRLEFWPVPDSNFASQIMYYYYTKIPTDLAAATEIPIIPLDYHWLIVEKTETLYRKGPIRVGGDGLPSQIDLFSIAERKVKEGMARLISRDSAVGGSDFSWQDQEPSF
jgi:hypothetical protein